MLFMPWVHVFSQHGFLWAWKTLGKDFFLGESSSDPFQKLQGEIKNSGFATNFQRRTIAFSLFFVKSRLMLTFLRRYNFIFKTNWPKNLVYYFRWDEPPPPIMGSKAPTFAVCSDALLVRQTCFHGCLHPTADEQDSLRHRGWMYPQQESCTSHRWTFLREDVAWLILQKCQGDLEVWVEPRVTQRTFTLKAGCCVLFAKQALPVVSWT